MLPHTHFLIAGLAIAPVAAALYPEKTAGEVAEWAFIGGLLSAAIDLDIVALVLLRSRRDDRLRLFRNPVEIYRKFRLFMDMITETGVLRTGLMTHLAGSAIVILICVLFASSYIVPAALAVLSHLLSDIPNLRRLSA